MSNKRVTYEQDLRAQAKLHDEHLFTIDVTGMHLTKEQYENAGGNLGRMTMQGRTSYPMAAELARLSMEIQTGKVVAEEHGHARLYLDIEYDPSTAESVDAIALWLDKLLAKAIANDDGTNECGLVDVEEFMRGAYFSATADTSRRAINRYQEFMRLNASAGGIKKFLDEQRLTPGIDWSGSSKGLMAESYAIEDRSGHISDKAFARLVETFGQRPA